MRKPSALSLPVQKSSVTLEQIASSRSQLESQIEAVSNELKALPRTSMGLIPDEVRASDRYQRLKSQYDQMFHKLRQINSQLTSNQKRALSRMKRKGDLESTQ